MKRFLSLAAALVLAAGFASDTLAGPIHAGVRGGVNVANQSADDESLELSDSLTGLAVGGFVAVPVSRSFSIQPEALFMMKGDEGDVLGVPTSTKYSYIEVPVLAKVSFMQSPSASVKPAIFAGPSLSLNTSAKAETEVGSTPVEVDIKDQTKTVDFGVVFGGAVDFPLGPAQSIGLDVRYTAGLSNINDIEGSNIETKNGTLTITGSWSFI